MAIEIHSAKDIRRDKPVRVLLYGASKVGKTYFCGDLPKPIFLSPTVEGGIRTLQGRDIPYIEIATPDDVEQAYQYLLSAKSRKLYQTVVVDSLTFMQNNVYMPAILSVRGTMFPDQRDWGQLLENMRRLTRQMADLPYDVWFTCLEEDKEDDNIGILTRPLLTGKFAGEAPAYCDIVIRLVVDTKKRKVGEAAEITRYMLVCAGVPGFGNYVAGDRNSEDLPKYIKNPTARRVLAAIRGTKESTATPKEK